MKINCISGIQYDSNIYIIDGEIPTIIDCGTGLNQKYVDDKIKQTINPLKIQQIILTHEHFDHCGGAKNILDLTNKKAKILSHNNAAEKIEGGDSYFARMLGGYMPKINIDYKIKDNENVTIGDEKFQIIHTPGHSPGCICMYNKKNKILFSGDTIFAYGSFGRYDFPGGKLSELKQSIKKISKLDIENLYPGHESFIEGNAQLHINKTLENITNMI